MATVIPGPDDAGRDLLERMVADQPTRLHRKMRAAGFDASDADDLAQETLTRALRSLGGVRGSINESLLCGWVDRIATNLVRNQRRAAARRPGTEALDEAGAVESDDGADVADRVACRAALESLLSVLPEEQRAVFVARVLEERTTAEVAHAAGISEDLVRWRLRRARERLREQVDLLG